MSNFQDFFDRLDGRGPEPQPPQHQPPLQDDDGPAETADDDAAPQAEAVPEPIPAVTVAAKSNRAGTITVRATNQGMPVEVTISREELRYGAQPLADQILQLCRLATTEAGMRRRDLLSERGIPDEILNRLGLPSREPAPAGPEDDDWTPTTWLRKV